LITGQPLAATWRATSSAAGLPAGTALMPSADKDTGGVS
jgi:hypothetical protein